MNQTLARESYKSPKLVVYGGVADVTHGAAKPPKPTKPPKGPRS